MLSLLIAVAIIYFILGQNSEAYFMLAAIIAVSEFFFTKTTAVEKRWKLWKKLNPLSTVFRNGRKRIPQEIVVNDLVIAKEATPLTMEK
jgi:Ca2+-transporting ATPase